VHSRRQLTVVHAAAVEDSYDGLGLRADRVVEGRYALQAQPAALVHVHVHVFHLQCARTPTLGKLGTVPSTVKCRNVDTINLWHHV
jgi:hypothetical protein